MHTNKNNPVKIVITGPESTGKTTLSQILSEHYKCPCIQEYAREYVEKLNRAYNYDDVVKIAHRQIEIERRVEEMSEKMVIYDTHLILTKVWFNVVYNKCPKWFIDETRKRIADFYLICAPDLEWVYDKVRENPGDKRKSLFGIYKSEIELYNRQYAVIEGKGDERTEKAILAIDGFLTQTARQ